MFKTIAIAAGTALIVSAILMLSGLVGSNQPSVGGDTRFPNSDLSAKSLSLTGTGTTTLETGKVCIVTVTNSGATIYAFFNQTGNLATSTASCL